MELTLNRISDPRKRYDFVLLVDIADGNPNGDPDCDNRPRVDEETDQGLISDVCMKRKVRDYVDIVHGGEDRNAIYVLNRGEFLETVNGNLVKDCMEDKEFLSQYKNPLDKKKNLLPKVISDYFCQRYFDVRCFGAVPGKPMEKATIRGPIQMQFGRSVDPVYIHEHAISRVVQNKTSMAGSEEVHGTFGAKYTVRYGLYRFAGHYSPFLAERTGFNEGDLALLWESLVHWPVVDSSAARSSMAVRGLYVFGHDSRYGNAPAHELFSRIMVPPVGDPRSFSDYTVTIDGENLPAGVTLTRVVG